MKLGARLSIPSRTPIKQAQLVVRALPHVFCLGFCEVCGAKRRASRPDELGGLGIRRVKRELQTGDVESQHAGAEFGIGGTHDGYAVPHCLR